MFDAKLREALLAALAAKLGDPLPVSAVVRWSKTKNQELNATLPDFTADGHPLIARPSDVAVASMQKPWARDLNGSGLVAALRGRVLMALSLAAAHLTLPGPQDLEVVQADKSTTMRAARDFASGTLLLRPQVLGMQQIPGQCSHPHKVAVRWGRRRAILFRVGRTHGRIHSGRPVAFGTPTLVTPSGSPSRTASCTSSSRRRS